MLLPSSRAHRFIAHDRRHEGDTPPGFAARIARSPIRTALVDAMDDWSICAADGERLEWLLSAIRIADPGSAWRQRARDSATWTDPAALAALAREADIESEPVALLLIVAGRLLLWGRNRA